MCESGGQSCPHIVPFMKDTDTQKITLKMRLKIRERFLHTDAHLVESYQFWSHLGLLANGRRMGEQALVSPHEGILCCH